MKTNSTAVTDSVFYFLLGRLACPNVATRYDFDGKLAEVRLENVSRSSNWIWACWFNQASNASFAAYQAVETNVDPSAAILVQIL